jgi:hypothetical protein
MTRPDRFEFVDDLDGFATETPGVVEVPAGITSKPQLMRELVRSLSLPDYFGSNWDALDECFRDWLLDDGRQSLCLLHRDLPLAQDPQNCRDYLTLLDDTLAWAKETATCEFVVAFPVAAGNAIEQLVGRNDGF